MAAEIIPTKPAEAPKSEVTKWDQPLDLSNLTVTQMRFMGQAMADSGMFPDLQKDSAKAVVKILAGQEIGVTPFQAMTGINIIQGKAALGSNIMAAKLKGSPKYDYRADVSSDACTIHILQKESGKYEEIGSFTYSMADAKRQGLDLKDNWKKYPQNMLFARAISNAIRMFAPDVFNGGLVYDPDELGAVTNQTGTIIAGGESGSAELDEAIEKIRAAKDPDELTNIVTELPADLQKKVTTHASQKFQELTDEPDTTN